MRKTWKKAAAGMCAAMMALSVANVGPAVMQVEAQTFDGTGNASGDGLYTINSEKGIKAYISAQYGGTTSSKMSLNTGGGSSTQTNSFDNVVDGNIETNITLWQAAPTSGDYIKLEFESPINLNSIDFLFFKECKIPKAKIAYQVKGSNTWQTLKEAAAHSADGDNLHFTGEYTASEEGIQMVTAVKLETTQTAAGWGWSALAEISIDGTAINLTGELEIETLPSKTVYKVGEELNTTGLVVKQYGEDNVLNELTSDQYEITTSDVVDETTGLGTRTVTITAGEKTTSFDVTLYTPGGFYPQQALTVVTGSTQGASGDGPIEYAFDGDTSTHWHSRYNNNETAGVGTPNVLSDAWITMEFEETTIVDGLEYIPRENSINGVITGYEIEGSVNGTDYFKLADGTWNGTQDAVQTLEFPAIGLKALKLTPTHTKGNPVDSYASAAEINVRTATSETPLLMGTSLRMDYQDVETEDGGTIGFAKTGLRFGYTFPKTLNGMNVSDWDWDYGLSAENLNITNFPDMPNKVESGDNYISNLVIGGTDIAHAINAADYAKDYYSRIRITYGDSAGIHETIYSTLIHDNVCGFADRAMELGKDEVPEATLTYAAGIKAAWEATKTNNN